MAGAKVRVVIIADFVKGNTDKSDGSFDKRTPEEKVQIKSALSTFINTLIAAQQRTLAKQGLETKWHWDWEENYKIEKLDTAAAKATQTPPKSEPQD